jgi:WD40 repeat protein
MRLLPSRPYFVFLSFSVAFAALAIGLIVRNKQAGEYRRQALTASTQIEQLRADLAAERLLREAAERFDLYAPGRAGAATRPDVPRCLLRSDRFRDEILAVAFSRDASHLAGASADGAIRVWDTATGQEVQKFEAGSAKPVSLTFSPGGLSVAYGAWELTSDRPPKYGFAILDIDGSSRSDRAFSGERYEAKHIAYSPDGKFIAMTHIGGVSLWKQGGSKPDRVLSLPRSSIECLAFSPKGDLLAIGDASGPGTITIWEVATDRKIGPIKAHDSLIYCLLFSPDGACLVSGGRDHQIRIWDTANGREMKRLPDIDPRESYWPGRVYDLCYDASGRTIASIGNMLRVSLWDATTLDRVGSVGLSPKSVMQPPPGQDLTTLGMRFAPNGRSLVLWGNRGREGSVHWWIATWEVPWDLAGAARDQPKAE